MSVYLCVCLLVCLLACLSSRLPVYLNILVGVSNMTSCYSPALPCPAPAITLPLARD